MTAEAGVAPLDERRDAASDEPAPSASLTTLYDTVFVSCRMLDCHGSGWGDVDMSSKEATYAAFVGPPATTDGPCAEMGWMRVVPGKPEESLLIAKLDEAPPCGLPMPPGMLLSAEERDLVRRWVEEGALDN